jgi:tetratricopeptide (TPR) repeat protein
MRRLVILLLPLCFLNAEERPQPQPALPPEPRSLHLAPAEGTRPRSGDDLATIDQAALAEELAALARTVKRVEETIGTASASTVPGMPVLDADHRTPIAITLPDDDAEDGAVRTSAVYERALIATRRNGGWLITATIDGEPGDKVVKDLCQLIGLPAEDLSLAALRRSVELRVEDVPWADAMDRVLGQRGLTWRIDGDRKSRRFIATAVPTAADESAVAVRALERAANGSDPAIAAEARWLLATRQLDARQPVEAMRLFNQLVQDASRSPDAAVRRWALRATRSIGDCLAQLGQWRDARRVYRSYISRAAEDDDGLPAVFLASAEAGRKHGIEKKDPLAFDEAIEDLHALLEKYGEHDDRAEIPAGRLLIGGLLYDAGRFSEAETQLRRHATDTGGEITDTVRFQLADCALRLDRIDEARDGFEMLLRGWISRGGSTQIGTARMVYEQAAFNIGQCYLRERKPRFVHALFAFQRAQHEFPKTALTPELLLTIARCHAEIERDDDAVAALWELLKHEGGDARQDADAQGRLDASMGQLMSRLGEYPGPIRARALFYIAQAGHRRAERDRTAQRTVLAAQAVGFYERVMGEDPSPELRDAARLGLARASLAAGNDQRGELELRNLLKDPSVADRDRAYASRLLGEHLRLTGRTREAIRAFDGQVETPAETAQ